MPNLPTDAKARKNLPIATGVLDYFPDALAAVAEVSRLGNEQHNPGQPLHWSRGKSMDQADTLIRHFLERGTRDTDGTLHSAKVAWRALALLQLEIEAEAADNAPVAVQFAECDKPAMEPPRQLHCPMTGGPCHNKSGCQSVCKIHADTAPIRAGK